jgi:hypothetical protein
MPFSDFWERANLIQEFKKEEAKTQMIAQTWNAWLMGAAPGKTFDWMLTNYGLKEKPAPLTPEQRHAIAEKNYADAAKIIEFDQGR